jgi:hypothetical protein
MLNLQHVLTIQQLQTLVTDKAQSHNSSAADFSYLSAQACQLLNHCKATEGHVLLAVATLMHSHDAALQQQQQQQGM